MKIQAALIVLIATSGCVTTKTIESKPTTGAISGKVVDASTGEPVPGVAVIILGTDKDTFTNDEGSYSLQAIPFGIYDIEFTMLGYQPVVVEAVEVFAPHRRIVRVRLKVTTAFISF